MTVAAKHLLRGSTRIAVALIAGSHVVACTGKTSPDVAPASGHSSTAALSPSAPGTPTDTEEESTMIVTVNGHDLELRLSDNSSARALTDLAGEDGLELTMEDYGGFEKVGTLPQRLPTNDEQIATRPGDVILYQGDKLAIYYGTNTWRFTRIGRINLDADRLRRALGDRTITATLHNS